MKLRVTNLLNASAIALSVAAPAAFAQDSGEVADQIVVTGTYLYTDQVNALRTPTPIVDVPQSLTIVTADQFHQQGFDSVGDIINYIPGVSNSQGEGHRDAVVFRGVRSTADFFIDGVRDDVQYYRPLYNIEQVEILRGPNALLFGRGGTGGILNRVTKKGVLGEDFTGYRASVDTFGAFGVELDTNFSTSDSSAIRLNAMYESLNNHRDFYDGEQIGLNPTAHFELSSATTLDLSYEFIDHERFIDRGIPTGTNGEPVEAFQDIVFGDPELNTTELQAHIFRATLQHRFSDTLKGRVSAFYGDYDKMYQNLYASGYDQAASPNVVTLDGYLDTTQRQNFILSGDLIGEFQMGGLRHTVVAGVEYIDTVNNNDRYNTFFDQTADDNESFIIQRPLDIRGGVGVNASGDPTSNDFTVSINDDTEADVSVFSVYLQDEIEISEKLDIIIGARFDSFEIDVYNVVADESRSRSDEEISPRFGIVFKPQENVSLYGSYSESFLPRSGEQFANINGSNNALDPNTYTNLEAGVKWDFSSNLSFTAAVFEIEQSSPQVADNDPSTLDVIDSETTGFEAQLQGQLTDQWYVSAGYSHLDGEIVNRSGATGLRPRELPENMFSIWSGFQINDQLGFGAGLTYQDESFINNSNTATLPAFTRVDAAVFYDVSETFRIQLNVENLTDDLYFPTSHSTHQATVGAPLNARLTISGQF
ncbi:MAG: TonB-dependent siderophore receptor [Maricaulis sp.]|uniref:TonB-dependent receptor n=1 Tax=Maricaulis sp. TaxID=1486257 RepID=UPI001B22D8FD|nr:TonB-dependent siderophore receptor [Maricaulis sp.]MBO6728819.1 TonB-dependent siderophore receptor [Maricaulis sp.]MBO6847613.1 TonB-dependent siderophore receptor [Maricaulis sp.]MBO6876960.1 TonB-dependent siderophore receptor [Maricaulis sp.]MDM7985251.1 TonB-dependent siderophore receptor [Maricaulis sp.]